MASEARITTSLQIKKGNLFYQNQPQAFIADMEGDKGPSPGAITVGTAGTDVDFSELAQPGLCRIMNLDEANFVTFGIWDGEFHPLGELLPGESYVLRISRELGSEFGVGTGTSGSGNTLRFKADTAACDVLVEAFEA
jgi:hypothetical protein